MKILHVVGARPNFMKASPVLNALAKRDGVSQMLVHTGQHYDANMSEIFFKQLGIPEPDINLEVGSASHAVQTAQIMMKFEQVILSESPDWVLVYGDVNSTVAAALVCAKLLVPIAHVEAGLRSNDRSMPEEINRLMTDQVANMLFTPSADGDENLLREGVAAAKIKLVGNVMIDTLVRLLPQIDANWPATKEMLGLTEQSYGLITLHRPSNVDDPEMLKSIFETLAEIAREMPLVFPIHPRTRNRLKAQALEHLLENIQLIDPQGYFAFLGLQKHAKVVITDSGGVQEETTYLGVPCLTVRNNTERPITIDAGTNILIGQDMVRLKREVAEILAGRTKTGQVPPLWEGKAGERIADILTAG